MFELLIKQFNGPFHFLLCTFTRTTSPFANFNTYNVCCTLNTLEQFECIVNAIHTLDFICGFGLVPSWSDAPPPARPVTLRGNSAVTYNIALPCSCTSNPSFYSATARSRLPRPLKRCYSLKQDWKAETLHNGNI